MLLQGNRKSETLESVLEELTSERKEQEITLITNKDDNHIVKLLQLSNLSSKHNLHIYVIFVENIIRFLFSSVFYNLCKFVYIQACQ